MQPEPPALHLLLAHYIHAANEANALGNFAKAREWCKLAERIDNSFPELWFNLAVSELGMGNRHRAIANLKEARQRASQSAAALNSIGLKFFQIESLEDAESCFSDAINLSPDYAPAYSNLGRLKQLAGALSEAITQYESAIKIDPNSPAFHINLCSALQEAERPDDAISAGEHATALAPDNVHAWVNLAAALDMSDQPELALINQSTKYVLLR